MYSRYMLLLIFFAFIAGFVTILSPCILPVLPVVLSGSLSGGKKRPLGVITGFIGSFTFFTLFLSTIVRATGIPSDFLRNVAIALIFFFGFFLIVPQAQKMFEVLVSKLSSLMPQSKNSSDSGFFGGVLVGTSLGLIWAPCVGPILASVITLSITAEIGVEAVLLTLAYATGTAIPMLVIALSGRKIFTKLPWLLEHTTQIQQFFGVIMIFTAIGLFFRIDTQFQAYILETFPEYGAGLTQIEDTEAVRNQLNQLNNPDKSSGSLNINSKPESILFDPEIQAPGFQDEASWINSEPLTLEELRGQVVLVDFWTYTCINCIRTLPYLKEWHDKYSEQGLTIVGVHSPEFEFEKLLANVQQAASDYELEYPIIQDNDFAIWRAYNNRYWPAKYLIDANGYIRYTHFGEGKYVETENAIRELLNEAPIDKAEATQIRKTQTPEIYLGYDRAEHYLKENELVLDRSKEYEPFLQNLSQIPNDGVVLEGSWIIQPENITATQDKAKLYLNYLAKNIFLVLTPPDSGQGTVKVTIGGKVIETLTITQDDKYDIYLGDESKRGILELEFSEGVSAFAFTFGS